MKVLIFHGYLLSGTGSNVYNASLATALARLGHEVHVVCQDRDPPELGAGASGSVTVHNPDIGGLLPVFVQDAYEGFEVKTFAELTDGELDRYIDSNVTAVRELVDSLGGVDAALANHLIMGPVILGRAGLDYALAIHGSDLSYTVIPDLERWGPYAQEACDGAAGILVGSGHIAARLRQAVDDPATNAKVRLGPPGVDTRLFAPIPRSERRAAMEALAARLRELEQTTSGSSWDRDPAAAATAVDWYAEAEGPRVIFVGKLIVSKGVDLLLAAWPLVHRANPGARLLIVGFGALDPVLRDVWDGLAARRRRARRGRSPSTAGASRRARTSGSRCSPRSSTGCRPTTAMPPAAAAGSVRFAGRLEHDEVAVPVSSSTALVFPSTFPEAFGMVAAEAASAGALPVSAAHSGAAEVSQALAAELPDVAKHLVSFELRDDAVEAIAARLRGWLELEAADRRAASASLRDTVERLWSWESVARGVLDASAGRLDELPVPKSD